VNWYNLDSKSDKVSGVSVDKAYNELLKGKSAKKKIVVAVIDGGVDTAHADLKGHIWKNTDEIPGNGIDDDNNGYVDDIYGWNFLGTKGYNLNVENLEYTRILKKLKPIFKNVKSKDVVSADQMDDYKLYLACTAKYNEEYKTNEAEQKGIEKFEEKLNEAETKIKEYLKKDKITESDLQGITSTDAKITSYKDFLVKVYKQGITAEVLKSAKEQSETYLDKYLNFDFNPRDSVGDDPENISDTKYGNNDVSGTRADHGTLCAGIIAAKRDNGIGINGIASDVLIMALRVVPDGDERDKDIALAIRYAVDNGANVINMSFGKAFSPQKKFVDDAFKYAEQHNVLLIHAAGNDGMNNDSTEHYPTKNLNDGTVVKNMINVGASNLKLDKTYPAFFSNYGQSVDLFAPGMNIVSTVPGSNYDKANGTSFSCPVVSGVAALVWSYYPDLTALQLKEVLLSSVTSQAKLKVNLPNKESDVKKIVKFSTLCSTAGTVNAYKALKAADKMTNAKKDLASKK
jgi:subtilisin family serine protease